MSLTQTAMEALMRANPKKARRMAASGEMASVVKQMVIEAQAVETEARRVSRNPADWAIAREIGRAMIEDQAPTLMNDPETM